MLVDDMMLITVYMYQSEIFSKPNVLDSEIVVLVVRVADHRKQIEVASTWLCTINKGNRIFIIMEMGLRFDSREAFFIVVRKHSLSVSTDTFRVS